MDEDGSFAGDNSSYLSVKMRSGEPSYSKPDLEYQRLKNIRDSERRHAVLNGIIRDSHKARRLENAIAIVGTCQEMCPGFERIEREYQNNTDRWERVPGTMSVDPRRAVKAFHRPAAGDDEALPSDIRPPLVLKKTLDYLFRVLLPQGTLFDTHSFVRDRTRSIRQDFTVQNERGSVAIECHERIARYHILCLHELHDMEGQGSYQEAQELEQLRKVLQSLNEFYDDRRALPDGESSPNEAEFRGYYLLTHFRDADVLRSIELLPSSVFMNASLQAALSLTYKSQRSNMLLNRKGSNSDATQNFFSRLMKLLTSSSVTFLQAAVLETHFREIHSGAIKAIRAAQTREYGFKFPLSRLSQLLSMDDIAECKAFCQDCELEILAGSPDAVVMHKSSTFIEGTGSERLSKAIKIGRKKGDFRYDMIIDGHISSKIQTLSSADTDIYLPPQLPTKVQHPQITPQPFKDSTFGTGQLRDFRSQLAPSIPVKAPFLSHQLPINTRQNVVPSRRFDLKVPNESSQATDSFPILAYSSSPSPGATKQLDVKNSGISNRSTKPPALPLDSRLPQNLLRSLLTEVVAQRVSFAAEDSYINTGHHTWSSVTDNRLQEVSRILFESLASTSVQRSTHILALHLICENWLLKVASSRRRLHFSRWYRASRTRVNRRQMSLASRIDVANATRAITSLRISRNQPNFSSLRRQVDDRDNHPPEFLSIWKRGTLVAPILKYISTIHKDCVQHNNLYDILILCASSAVVERAWISSQFDLSDASLSKYYELPELGIRVRVTIAGRYQSGRSKSLALIILWNDAANEHSEEGDRSVQIIRLSPLKVEPSVDINSMTASHQRQLEAAQAMILQSLSVIAGDHYSRVLPQPKTLLLELEPLLEIWKETNLKIMTFVLEERGVSEKLVSPRLWPGNGSVMLLEFMIQGFLGILDALDLPISVTGITHEDWESLQTTTQSRFSIEVANWLDQRCQMAGMLPVRAFGQPCTSVEILRHLGIFLERVLSNGVEQFSTKHTHRPRMNEVAFHYTAWLQEFARRFSAQETVNGQTLSNSETTNQVQHVTQKRRLSDLVNMVKSIKRVRD